MTHDHGSMEPRYATLRDYLRVLQAYRAMIAIAAVVGVGIALALSLSQTSVYRATASIDFKQPTSEFSFVGLAPSPSNEPPTQFAAAQAKTVTRPNVLAMAARRLGVTQLGASVSTAVDASSSLVDVSAQANDPRRAARVANAVAGAAVATSNKQLRSRFAHAARALRKQSRGFANGAAPNAQLYTQSELARLDSLSHFAQAANIVDHAGVPSSPVSPKPTRSAAIGLVGGLLAGILLAFLRDSLDRRLRSAHDIQSHYGLPVLGYVRDRAMGHMAHLANGSPGRNGGLDQLDLEAFRIMRRNLDFVKPGGELRSILVTSAFPAEGKTTVASALAFSMAVGGKRTLLVESDLRRPVLAARLGFDPTPGLSDYLAGHAKPADVLRTVKFKDPPLVNGAGPSKGSEALVHTVVCIPAGTPTSHAAEHLGSDRLKVFLGEVTRSYDAVVIDSSPLLPVADTRELLPHVDAVIVCARESQTTREQVRATRETLEHLPERPTVLVVTGTRPDEEGYAGYAYGYAYQARE